VLFADDEQGVPTIFELIVVGRQADLPSAKGSQIGLMNGDPPVWDARPTVAFDVAAARVIYLDRDRGGKLLSPKRDLIQGSNTGPSDVTARGGAGQF
jgi:hypothetical protein